MANKLLLKSCRLIVTQDERRRILENEDILIEDSKISKIGKIKDSCPSIDCSDKVVMPGLVNLHTHTITNMLRGVSDDLRLQDWLEKKVWPAEAKIDSIYFGSLLTCIESIKNGTTCMMDMSTQMENIIKAVRETGIRAFLGRCMIDLFKKEDADAKILETRKFVEGISGDPLITPTISAHAPNTCSEYLLKAAVALAKEYNLINQTHILETEAEISVVRQKTGLGVMEYLEKIGFLDERTVGVHLCWLDEHGVKLMAKHNSAGVHCPVSNMKLASGSRMPLDKMLELTVRVGLGTDSVASNNNLDIFEEMKQVGLLHKYSLNDPTAMPGQVILDLATINPASILGLKIGTIAPGYFADIITLSTNNPKLLPLSPSNVVSHIIYSVSGSDVTDTIVNGKVLMENRRLLILDEFKALAKIQGYFKERNLF